MYISKYWARWWGKRRRVRLRLPRITHVDSNRFNVFYSLPRPKMAMPDLTRLINSDEIQKVVRPAKPRARRATIKKNPLRNSQVMMRLNPHSKATKRAALVAQEKRREAKDKVLGEKRNIKT